MADDVRRLRKRLKTLRDEATQLKLRISAYEKVVKEHDRKNPDKWHEATRELKSLRERRRENTRRQEEIRDVLGE